ncbi:helix-turn-helix transcriptional regulator [Pararcticibacter amylolyticus]|uniref:LuxR family transcriptional regulator n=1 Tax=Pararcticibacter amylolyticus TaxID=2173175 RepID=A0A2U2PHC1_9SPHI|nr:helix-turn-helix transcriptional regulator [Pararcticibacter amylolyticus]PWG80813.1 LuxR family transcriptional regulator [Pararcticibacter amylolyticus]
MFAFGEMHGVTLVIVVIECCFLFYQVTHYLAWPDDKSRFWYLVLLALLIFYNVTGGFFPDPNIRWLPVMTQNIIAYGGGFLMASYFPFFFFKGFGVSSLRWHALVGVPLFLLLPYVTAFLVVYPLTADLEKAITWGMPVPFLYSIVLIWVILVAVRRMFDEEKQDGQYNTKLEMMLVYCSVAPWVLMSVFSWLHVTQWVEVLVTNLGFLFTTFIFISRSIRAERLDKERLLELQNKVPFSQAFERNILLYRFTERELEVVRLIRQGYSRAEIADMLCISIGTLGKHIQFIHEKAEVSTRQQLMAKLEMP